MTDAANRAWWTVIGVLLTAAGVSGVLVHFDLLPRFGADTPLLGPQVLDLWRRGGSWSLPIVMAAGVIVALVGLLLLRAQLRRRGEAGMSDVVFERTTETPVMPSEPTDYAALDVKGGVATAVITPAVGRTKVRAGGITRALERDVAAGPSVRKASVALTGDAPDPVAWIRLDLKPEARVADAREQLDTVLARFGETTGLRVDRLDVTVRPDTGEGSSRVR
ncbi:hypothetical protein [Phytomonospora endophytica]|uniref:Alkaline shock response membrane anchor protein AmaP n=1 Tax=Phytomonospora endophytica TaxID=714109 RepID=A0A841FSW4_9ACTN|nr:hypothetical protein [Phytomonospora endophytica]MBB6039126.1 hypothetical protein [Phytomonospora endophytica]GIG67637.1 hypothetical protein Pen01_39320 [Phytomonospora endophytica]